MGRTLDIFERIYAVRLDQIRKLSKEDLVLLRPLDRLGLQYPAAIFAARSL
jgi:hypothetical protein